MSDASWNVWPQKRGNVGKQRDASTPLTSMSSSRSFTANEPGRMSSYVMPFNVTSSRSKPTAESRRISGRRRFS